MSQTKTRKRKLRKIIFRAFRDFRVFGLAARQVRCNIWRHVDHGYNSQITLKWHRNYTFYNNLPPKNISKWIWCYQRHQLLILQVGARPVRCYLYTLLGNVTNWSIMADFKILKYFYSKYALWNRSRFRKRKLQDTNFQITKRLVDWKVVTSFGCIGRHGSVLLLLCVMTSKIHLYGQIIVMTVFLKTIYLFHFFQLT